MAYQSVHSGPAIDAAVTQLADIQIVRDESNANLATVQNLAAQVATDAGTASTAAASATQSLNDATAAIAAADHARQEQIDAEIAIVADQRFAAEQAATEAVAAADAAVATVTQDMAASVPTPNKLPLANALGKIASDWLGADIARGDALSAADGAGLVGFQQSGAGAVARTLQDKAREVVSVKDFGAVGDGIELDDEAFGIAQQRPDDVYVPPGTYNITQTYSGNFVVSSEAMFAGGGKLLRKKQPMWQGPLEPASVRRETRLLVGDTAYDYGGIREVSESAVSWLGKKDFVAPNGTLQPNLGWIERNARASSYTSEGAIGFAGAARTFEMSGGASIGLIGVGLNDNQVNEVGAWGLYLDVKRYPNSPGTTWGAEIAVCNHGEFVEESDPSSSAKTYGTIYAAGADPAINGTTNDCTLAVGISNNGARWGAGISFGSSALRVFNGEAGVEAFMKAIILRGSQRVGWETGAGQTLSYITSKVVDPAKRVGLTFRDSTVDIDTNGGRLLRASYAAGDVAWPRIWTSSAELAAVRIGVEGLGNCSLRLEAAGSGFVVVNRSLKPVLDNAFSSGSSDARWNQVYAATGTINTSDAREKQQIREISTAERAVAARLKSLIRAFKFNDAVAAKAESARIHFGVIAQDVKAAFEAEGLVAEDYAILCYDEWDEQPEIVDEDGNVTREYRPSGNRYGVRYEELLAFIIGAL